MMDTLSNDPEDGSLQKKKVKKFRLFGKKKSQPDPNCPQCNPHLLVALEQQQRQQQLYLQQQQQLQYHQQLQQQRQLQRQQMLAEAEASRAGRRHARRAMDDSPGAIVEDYGDDDDDAIRPVASSSTSREGGASATAAAAGGARVGCDCHRCQQARSERQLTVELLPMDTQVPLQNMMQDAAVLCALL